MGLIGTCHNDILHQAPSVVGNPCGIGTSDILHLSDIGWVTHVVVI
jgi:hypothetical protein